MPAKREKGLAIAIGIGRPRPRPTDSESPRPIPMGKEEEPEEEREEMMPEEKENVVSIPKAIIGDVTVGDSVSLTGTVQSVSGNMVNVQLEAEAGKIEPEEEETQDLASMLAERKALARRRRPIG
jgi:hypothetical protein